jgi:hypothetical protein
MNESDKKEWVGLTYAEISEEADRLNLRDGTLNGAISFANVIAAKLKEKNAYGWQSVNNPTEWLDDLRGGEDE